MTYLPTKASKLWLKIMMLFFIVISGLGYYAWQIEPYSHKLIHLSNARGLGFEVINDAQVEQIQASQQREQATQQDQLKQVSNNNNPVGNDDFQDYNGDLALTSPQLKLIQITDTHLKASYNATHLKKIVASINSQNPDVVVFTGDLFDFYDQYPNSANAVSFLKSIKAKYAKLAIWGNRDYYLPAKKQYPAIIKAGGFKLLTNAHHIITLPSKQRVLITGIDDGIFGKPAIPKLPRGKFNARILLLHEPEIVHLYNDYKYDLALAGHSHGGQVSIPGLDYLIDIAISYSNHSVDYKRGLYNINPQGLQQLYVNPGLGTTLLPLRFNVKPEVTVFHINLED